MKKENPSKIKVLPAGPYQVDASVPLQTANIVANAAGESDEWEYEKAYELPENQAYFLCRCGHSKNKPFCDGAHQKVGFTGQETASREPYIQAAKCYRGEKVDILDQENLCAVARFCDKGESAWQYAIESGKPGYREKALQETFRCPSGRLTIAEKDGTLIEPPLPERVSPVDDVPNACQGPLWVQGGVPIEGADGKQYEIRNRVTLCRCGESSNMPFCDASHLSCPHMKYEEQEEV